MRDKEIKELRRRFIKYSLSSILTMAISPSFAQSGEKTKLVASRIWPAVSYTRVTFESTQKLNFKYFNLENPLRLVLDIEGIEIKDELKDLALKAMTDKYVSGFRVGINRPNVTRIVFELKEKINPQVFTIEPVDNYKHRLVLDIYPELDSEVFFANLIQKETAQKNLKLAEEEKKITFKTKKPKKVFVIALDAGHGGEDPGCIGATGTKEKDITLAIAKKLKEKIDQVPWLQAVLIRDGDYFIPLNQRVERARKAKADIFISIHADAFMNKEARGSSVFVLSERGATSTTTKWLEKKENDADLIGGVNLKKHDNDLAKTLLDLSLSGTIMDSTKLANFVLKEMSQVNDLHKRYVESAGFAVLKSPDTPSILIETAFLSNPEEEKKLKDKKHQEKIAEAIIEGINKYTEKFV